MGLKELQAWQLIQTHHKPADRKEYYQTRGSVWDIANRVFEERRKREMDPTLSLIRGILLDSPSNPKEEYTQNKLQEVHNLLENIVKWSSELQRLEPEKLDTLMKLGSGVGKILDIKDKLLQKTHHNS